MRKIYFVFLLINIFCFAQKKEGKALIDSLLVELPKMKNDTAKLIILNDISNIYQSYNPEKGLEFAQKALALSINLNYIDGQALAYKNFGVNKYKQSKFDEALIHFNKGLKLVKNQKTKSRILSAIGLVYYSQGNYTDALKYGNQSLLIAENCKDAKGQCAQLQNIGVIYEELENLPKSIKLFEKALIIAKANKLNADIPGIMVNLGNCYAAINQVKKAIFYLNQSALLAQKNGNIYTESTSVNSLSQLYTDIFEFDLALKNANQGLELNKKLHNDLGIATSLSLIGYAHLKRAKKEGLTTVNRKNLAIGLQKYQEAIFLEKNLGDTNGLASDYNDVAAIYELQGNYKEAFEKNKTATIYKDSVFNSENKETIKNLEDKREIDIRDKELKINKLSLEANQKQKWFYILGIGFLTILGGLLFYQSYKRKQINLKLEILNQNLDQANKTKTRFFSILNHDLRGPVANLIHFLHLQKDNPELLDEATKTRMQDKTIIGAENLLSSMEDILLWSKGQMENFIPQPKQVNINQLFDDTKKVFSGYLKINFDYQNPDNIEVFTDENYLKTIIRNLTSNAINVLAEYVNSSAIEKQIVWKAYKNNENNFLSITDNGPGAAQENFKALYDDTEVIGIKSGLGLHLIRDLAKAINCEIVVDSKIGQGTTFILKL